MKQFNILLIIALLAFTANAGAQEKVKHQEEYDHALNLGVGLGYYGYIGHTTPVLHADYEFGVARNFTLAPFIAYFAYTNSSYWGDPHNIYRYYDYRETVIPVGIKGSYYFDRIVGAGPKWDFYVGASLGFAFRTTTWSDGYGGGTTLNDGPSPLFIDLHLGTEYHLTRKAGLFLDLSTGISTIGLAVHF